MDIGFKPLVDKYGDEIAEKFKEWHIKNDIPLCGSVENFFFINPKYEYYHSTSLYYYSMKDYGSTPTHIYNALGLNNELDINKCLIESEKDIEALVKSISGENPDYLLRACVVYYIKEKYGIDDVVDDSDFLVYKTELAQLPTLLGIHPAQDSIIHDILTNKE